MAIVREQTFKNKFDWDTGIATEIDRTFITLGPWSHIVGKEIVAADTQHPLMQFNDVIFK